jgi:carboxyl-terminal processing protease
LTIARYYLPSGRTIQAKGVVPDVEVFPGEVPSHTNEFAIKERDLKKHLEGELAKLGVSKIEEKKEDKKEEKKDKKLISKEDILKDIQLKTALDSLKILSLTQKGN